jgi:hypothetical protein
MQDNIDELYEHISSHFKINYSLSNGSLLNIQNINLLFVYMDIMTNKTCPENSKQIVKCESVNKFLIFFLFKISLK